MRSKRISFEDYLIECLPASLWWFSRPDGFEAGREFNRQRREWCRIHHVSGLALIRHDIAAKLAEYEGV